MRKRGVYRRLYTYIGQEYVLSFFVSFLFFFFIFFVNQILVLAQKILLKNVAITDVLLLVVFSIPQFLMYTMPFSSLASASMVIGNLSSQNEVLALRASGVHIRRIFLPIFLVSCILSVATLGIADRLIPLATDNYRVMYTKLVQSMPSLQFDSYSSARFGKRVISNGLVKDNVLYDVIILDESDPSARKVISASQAEFTVLDLDRSLYSVDLSEPRILVTDSTDPDYFTYADASDMTLYLDLGTSSAASVSITPSQLSLTQLKEAIEDKRSEQESIERYNSESISIRAIRLGDSLTKVESDPSALSNALSDAQALKINLSMGNYSFHYQYYRSEFQKKIALSVACTILVFIAFPISFFRVKNGRLFGFGLSMLVACLYWFFIYFMHVKAVSTALNPVFFMWLPNAVVLLIGLVLIWRARK